MENLSFDNTGDRAASKHTYNESEITNKNNNEIYHPMNKDIHYIAVKKGKRVKKIRLSKNNKVKNWR